MKRLEIILKNVVKFLWAGPEILLTILFIEVDYIETYVKHMFVNVILFSALHTFMAVQNVIIMGAAGRDFHNFNTLFRDDKKVRVVCFTAAQIPDIAGRRYPALLAGKLYTKGIPIYPEEDLPELIRKYKVDKVVFSYSDVSHEYVMHRASLVNATGANFCLAGARQTMLKSKKPVIAICAVRTGAGKSQTTRRVVEILKAKGRKVVVVRHPMPYGDLKRQTLQRFETFEDLDKHNCTIEEREEYEPHLKRGTVVYAGVDYEKILRAAEKEADIIVWDGGNNDTPFFVPDLHIVVADPLRAGHELKYYLGETNLRMADIVVINKENSASKGQIEEVKQNIKSVNPKAKVIDAKSVVSVDNPAVIRGKRVLVIEDGPTLTHGGLKVGAGVVAAKRLGAKIVDPKPYVLGKVKKTLDEYDIGPVLPALGYGKAQLKDLEGTIDKVPCDSVLIATPINLGKLIRVNRPSARVFYELEESKLAFFLRSF